MESQTSEIVPGPFASLPQVPQARRPLLRTEHIQKRRKAKSLDGPYTRSLRMVKNARAARGSTSSTTAYIKTLRRDTGMDNVRDLVALDTNIT